MVSQKLLEELKQIIKEEYKLDLSMKVVSEVGNNLSNYFGQLAKLACENKYENENTGGATN